MTFFLKPQHDKNDEYAMIKENGKPKIYRKTGIRTIHQLGYVLVPLGFNIAISIADNNYGNKCHNSMYGPNPGKAPCIPNNINRLDLYLKGGKPYSIQDLINHYINF